MSIRAVIKMGNPILAKAAIAISDLSAWRFEGIDLHAFIQDMRDTMKHEGGIGIAAPQMACPYRIVIFGFDQSGRYPDADAIPFTVLINPEIKPLDDDMQDDYEGCLSVPGLRGLVPRFEHITYRGLDANGQLIERSVSGFHARVVQHECDHLDGILYPQRIKNLRDFGFEDELLKISGSDV